MRNIKDKFIFALFFLSLGLGIYRIWGYTLYEIPYGYDPGFFRHAIQTVIATLPSTPLISDPTLPYNEPLFSFLAIILVFIGFSPDQIIWPFLGFLSIMTGFSVYLLAKQTSSNRTLWLVAASIFFLSIVQYQEFWWNYWRNIVGIIFLLTSLALFLRKSPLVVLTTIWLFSIHRPSALYFVVVVAFYFLFLLLQKKTIPWKMFFLLFLSGILTLPLYAREFVVLTDMIAPITSTIGIATQSGTFFSSREFFFLIFPYFLLGIPYIFSTVEKREYSLVFAWFLAWLIWSVWRLFFYNRMFVFFDLFVILLAAYGVVHILSRFPKGWIALILIFFATQGYLYTTHAQNFLSRHTISREEFDIVENLDILLPWDATILSTHRFYTPWLLWYSKRTVLAPGMLENQIWDEKEWNTFYFKSSDEEKCRMIAEYAWLSKSLYVFVGDQQPALDLPSSCFYPILSNSSHSIVYEVLTEK